MPYKSLSVFCLVLLAVSIVGASSGYGPSNAWLHFGIGAIAIVVFWGFLHGGAAADGSTNVRNAIACSMILTYLLLVVSLLFYNVGMSELPKPTEALLTSFTTTIGIVIASYFGASAFLDAKKKSD